MYFSTKSYLKIKNITVFSIAQSIKSIKLIKSGVFVRFLYFYFLIIKSQTQ
jgi:hypothetical protein